MIKISYSITVCNERNEVEILINQLQKYIRPIDEIVVLFDERNGSDEVREYLETIENITLIRAEFNNNFAQFKNKIFDYATGDFIFQIDADEIPHHLLLSYLPDIIDGNPEVELYWVPRVNILDGDIEEVNQYVQSQGWNINEKLWVNWCDPQGRIYKNDYPRISWKSAVHETIQGATTWTRLPATDESMSLLHKKSLSKQIKQNELYAKL